MVNKSMIFWTCQNVQKRPQAPKHMFWDRNMKNLETRFQILKVLKNMRKMLTKKTMQNGSSASPNELMRFRNEAKPIWVQIQKHRKNAVII